MGLRKNQAAINGYVAADRVARNKRATGASSGERLEAIQFRGKIDKTLTGREQKAAGKAVAEDRAANPTGERP